MVKQETGARLSTASGQQVAVLCSGEAVSEASFYRWRKQLKGLAAPPVRAARSIDADALAVAEVSAPAAAVQERPPEPNLEVRLDLGHGLVLHIVRR